MSHMRSEPMSYCEMFVQPEAAFSILNAMGELGCVQLEDMTPYLTLAQRNFITEMCRYADVERILLYIEAELKKENLQIPPFKGDEPSAYKIEELNALETFMDARESDLTQLGKYQTQLLENLQEMQELLYVLQNIDPILGEAELQKDTIIAKTKSKGTAAAGDQLWGGRLHVRTGVVLRSKAFAFETMLFRISRGNLFFRPAAMDELFTDPSTGASVRKVAFIAVCQGEQLKATVDKICTGFHVNLHECPKTYGERVALVEGLKERIKDLDQVLRKSKYHRCKQLRLLARQWWYYNIRVKKSKAIYNALNLFSKDISRKCLIGECWVPDFALEALQTIFQESSKSAGSEVTSFVVKVDSVEVPPTYDRVNKFSAGFQGLISAYGDAKYREISPGLYTVVTFPFLFSVMFGDCGHGAIMLSFALWMVLNEKEFSKQRSTNEIWNIFFGGRYVILAMATSTMYTGFLYNDWFSKPFRLKDNYWINHYSKASLKDSKGVLTLDPMKKTKSWYLVGVDPIWFVSKNKIMNDNSLKMKMSIILGIIHMMFGLWLGLFNHLYFKHYYAIFFEFLPQLIFLTALFVWLVFLIIYKWFMYGPKETDVANQPGCAPLILIMFIDMCLFRQSSVEEGSSCKAYMFDNQETIQKALVLVGLVCIPIMLFGSPVYLVKTNVQKKIKAEEDLKKYLEGRKIVLREEQVDRTEQALRDRVIHYSESFGELMIHQGVHTIEYVLSTISHTASYLRLWALSLAHAQLSEMLWQMIFSQLALQDHSQIMGPIKIFVVFSVWAVFSVAILVLMEGLSAFLHTLRLHWVEFMTKFFVGSGRVFHPFSFRDILYGDNKEDKGDAICKVISKKKAT